MSIKQIDHISRGIDLKNICFLGILMAISHERNQKVNSGRTLFSQLMDFLPLEEFRLCVERYKGDYKVKSFSCLDQFYCLAFAQFTFRESLRDIETCLRSEQSKLYHMGIRGGIARNTLAHANETRDWRIFADFAQVLIAQARHLYQRDSLGFDLQETAYALDSTVIDLCLALFPWAHFRRHKGAVKMHTLLDMRGSIPSWVRISAGNVHDVRLLDELEVEPGAVYVMDRGYVDFARLHRLARSAAYFIVRAKGNLQFKRTSSRFVDRATGLRSDQSIRLRVPASLKDYPDLIRRVHYYDAETKRTIVLLTNHFELPSLTLTGLYRCRWKVELFFKWIKQHLRIKAFYGTSDNAVRTQLWIALAVYVLIAIIRKRLNLEMSLYSILQILSVSIFEKTPILQAFSQKSEQAIEADSPIQLTLFDL